MGEKRNLQGNINLAMSLDKITVHLQEDTMIMFLEKQQIIISQLDLQVIKRIKIAKLS